ncbi:MAG TPA: TerB family tellurite resistance protein [Geminicoccaceae bacterium]|nr:TerB family tellurite resistance protein [Geminicoccaceae bacterium]
MAIWGKIVGGTAGFAVGGPIGAILGAVAGHAFDHYRAEQNRRGQKARHEPPLFYEDPAETRRIAFATALIALAAKLSKADGRVTADEIRAFRRVFQIQDDEVGDIARIYNQAKESTEGFEAYARQIAMMFERDRYLLSELLTGLFDVARADGALNRAETDFLRRVAAIFGFDEAAFEEIRRRFTASARRMSGADDAYAVLGVSRDASDEEIRKVYRQLVREHHPDRLVAKGLPQELVEHANRTLAAINVAYDRIAKERKLR